MIVKILQIYNIKDMGSSLSTRTVNNIGKRHVKHFATYGKNLIYVNNASCINSIRKTFPSITSIFELEKLGQFGYLAKIYFHPYIITEVTAYLNSLDFTGVELHIIETNTFSTSPEDVNTSLRRKRQQKQSNRGENSQKYSQQTKQNQDQDDNVVIDNTTSDRTKFICCSNGEFSGVPFNIKDFECEDTISRLHPSCWSFSVPNEHVKYTKEVLLKHNWIEN